MAPEVDYFYRRASAGASEILQQTLTLSGKSEAETAALGWCESEYWSGEYLAELLRHCNELKQAPQDWMPWNYRHAIDPGATSTGPPG